MVAARAGLLCALAAAALVACPRIPPPAPPPAPPAPAPPPPSPETLPCFEVERIVVTKHERSLLARCTGGGERRFTVALGRVPTGAKERRGDSRVPEGVYHLVGVARASRFYRFWMLDYPSPADAERGLSAGRISRVEARAIMRAHEAGRLPPQDTALGGMIGLHGEGRRWRGDSAALDWTQGCLALADADLDFLIARTPPGTPVEIAP